jgi:hypothetical protein
MHADQTKRLMSGGRYPVLRAIGIIYLIGAALVAIGGIAGIIWALAAAPANWGDRFTLAFQVLAGSFLGVLGLLLVAEVIKLFIDMEHNTRMAAMAIAMRNEQTAGTYPTPASSVTVDGNTVPTTIHTNRIISFHSPDEETAEAALIRGH